ncbi:glycosyltransferase family 4 protein [Butyrivibrio sp. NC3005]|uniref:glycosyltransferase family 4 protein n=1 Tax=Butyrivibrio sp. NC3005 TaxID=1280685 RepID=UPI0004136C8E|nr:glycosyltransferase family 4 protein [Butyrivibrio sp. NC3005]
MNIVYVLPEFVTDKPYGGLAVYYDNISRLLAENGHNIMIVVLAHKNDIIQYYHRITVYKVKDEIENVNPSIPGSYMRKRSLILNSFVYKLLEKGIRIDLIQYPNFMALGFDRLKLPTVIRVSSFRPLLRYADKEYFDIHKEYKSEKIADFLEDISVIKADFVYSPSETTAKLVQLSTGRNIEVIESPFYPKFISECKENKINNLDKYILTFGSIKILKGIRLIGDGIHEVLEEFPNLKWLFIGREWNWITDEGYEVSPSAYIKTKAGEYSDRCLFIGEVTKEELIPYIRNCLFCVMPSRVDNLPNTCIEAMALGKIVIGTKGASFEQLIEDGKNGFLIERENVKQLVDKIIYVNNLDTSKIRQIEEAAVQRIHKMNPIRICEQLERIYEYTINNFHYDELYKNSIIYQNTIKNHNDMLMQSSTFSEIKQYIID